MSVAPPLEHPSVIERVAADNGGLATFYRGMDAPERRTFWACFSGWALDGMDFMIYPLVVGTIIKQWHVAAGPAGLAVTATLLCSAVGGWIGGFLCDRIGRVRVLQLSIVWFAGFSVVCALTQTFAQLLVARAVLGFGFGAEWVAGAVLMGETIRPQYRGRAVGCVQSAWAVGWGGAVLSQALLFSVLPPEQAWRGMFMLAALPAVFVFAMRRLIAEPAVAAEARRKQAASGERPSFGAIFAAPMLRTTILASLAATGAQGGYYAITSWLPRFLTTQRHLSVVNSTGYLASLIVGSFAGYLAGAWLADRIGRRNLFLVFSLGAIAITIAYTQLPLSDGWMLVLGLPLGFFAAGYFSGMGPFLTELYPTRLRGSGQGFCYNFGRGVGALFPALVGYLSAAVPLGDAIAIFAVLAYGLFFVAAFCLPETRGRILDADG